MIERRRLIRKQNESNRETKQKQRKQKRENVGEDIDLGRFLVLATTYRKYVNGLYLHEIENEFLLDHKGDFEMIGSMLIGRVELKSNIRFKKIDDFECFINATDIDYDSEVVTFNGYVYKLKTPQFNDVEQKRIR